jgi:hypothetical protein
LTGEYHCSCGFFEEFAIGTIGFGMTLLAKEVPESAVNVTIGHRLHARGLPKQLLQVSVGGGQESGRWRRDLWKSADGIEFDDHGGQFPRRRNERGCHPNGRE